MKITAVRHQSTGGLLSVCTDGPVEGWSPGVAPHLVQPLLETCQPLLVGQSVWERERLWRECRDAGLRAGLPPAFWAHVDIALWDLFAKAQELPLFRAVGGFRRRLPAVWRGTAADVEQVATTAAEARSRGYFGYCVSAADGVDLAGCLRAARSATDPDFRLLVDGGGRLNLETALAVARVLEEIGGHWFAEPLLNDDVAGLQKLADAVDVPIVAGRFMGRSILAGTRALTTRAVDRVCATLPVTGGITDALKLARGAEALQMNCEIASEPPCPHHAAAHVMGAVRNAELFVVGETIQTDYEPLSMEDGCIVLPLEPGLGLRPTAGTTTEKAR